MLLDDIRSEGHGREGTDEGVTRMVGESGRNTKCFSHGDQRTNVERVERRRVGRRALQQHNLLIAFGVAPFKSLSNFSKIRGAG